MRTIFVCLFVVGCADSSSDHSKACKDLAVARCGRLMACSATDFTRRYPSMDVCQTRLTQSCVNSFAAPQDSNTDARVSTCAAALPTQACNDFLAGITADACAVIAGPRAAG